MAKAVAKAVAKGVATWPSKLGHPRVATVAKGGHVDLGHRGHVATPPLATLGQSGGQASGHEGGQTGGHVASDVATNQLATGGKAVTSTDNVATSGHAEDGHEGGHVATELSKGVATGGHEGGQTPTGQGWPSLATGGQADGGHVATAPLATPLAKGGQGGGHLSGQEGGHVASDVATGGHEDLGHPSGHVATEPLATPVASGHPTVTTPVATGGQTDNTIQMWTTGQTVRRILNAENLDAIVDKQLSARTVSSRHGPSRGTAGRALDIIRSMSAQVGRDQLAEFAAATPEDRLPETVEELVEMLEAA